MCDEEYARAVENRRRTSRQVEDIDRSILKRIEEKKLAFQQISRSGGAALRRAKKEAYFQGWMPSLISLELIIGPLSFIILFPMLTSIGLEN